MSTLIIHSGHIEPERLTGHEVRIDGHPVGVLGQGESSEFPIEAGFHIVDLKLGRNGCPPTRVHARAGHPVELVVHEEHPGALGLFAGGWYSLAPA